MKRGGYWEKRCAGKPLRTKQMKNNGGKIMKGKPIVQLTVYASAGAAFVGGLVLPASAQEILPFPPTPSGSIAGFDV